MGAMSLLWILLFISFQKVYLQELELDYYDEMYEEPQPVNCSTTETIKGGRVTYSQGGLPGSVLTYHCEPGHYPFPVSHRSCSADGEWTIMRSANGRRLSQATCKELLCPGQLQLDHGEIWPRDQWFRPGSNQSFSCQEGFTLSGSAQRNCTLSGEWTGNTPACDNHADDCQDPGVPPGAQRTAGRFQTGDKVNYRCQSGLDLLGSAERVCLENREWSGTAPRCQGPHTFDSPSVVAAAMSGSLSGVMDVLSSQEFKQKQSFGRTIRVAKGSRLNIYILLDSSGSISKEDFESAKIATIKLIKKLDSYEVQMKFHVMSFASQAIDIVDINDRYASSNVDYIIWSLKDFDYKSHGRQTGTNLHAALHRVNEKIAFFKQNSKEHHFNETQNIIIIQTDGYSNTGTSPQIALAHIRKHLGYSPTAKDHTGETLLDIYVFGVGDQLNKAELNAIASKKAGEKHLFILKDYEILGEVFNSMISDKSVTMCGVAREDEDFVQDKDLVYTRPWLVTVCFGSIISQNWVLTAAHCFARSSSQNIIQTIEVEYGEGKVAAKNVAIHPEYNVRKLNHRNVSEFYDYDIALVQLNRSIPLSWSARPICLPCTVPASRALKKINSTCEEHRKELLSHKQTAAFFFHKSNSKGSARKETHIHTQDQRPGCVAKAMLTLTKPTNVTVDEYVTERFLCTGGSEGYQDSIACPGDSGGSLFLQKRMRYFQVGVLAWGTTDPCKHPGSRPGPTARDFYISLFRVVPWLKEHLGQEIQFLDN
uniref:C3/C5 convertase n=1 Tax=Myripristis murdjan TaxID=586833 RepID=A0A667XSE7_9TELE